MKQLIPNEIKNSNKTNCNHIFLISNPVNLVLSFLLTETYSIQNENIIFIYLRRLPKISSSIKCENGFFLKYFNFFKKNGLDIKLILIYFKLILLNKKFIVYAPWCSYGVRLFITSRLCMGHAYIEEGQQSFRELIETNTQKNTFLDVLIDKKDNIYCADRNDIFLDSSFGYFAISKKAFPLIQSKKKYVLPNLYNMKKHYSPKLIGIKTIGLTCATRRVNKAEWGVMLTKLIKAMSNEGVIKLHPSFTHHPIIKKQIMKIFFSLERGNVSICDENLIIELEMLYEKKIIIGPKSSLSVYAEYLNSNYIEVKLY